MGRCLHGSDTHISLLFLISLTKFCKPSLLQCAVPPRIHKRDQHLAEKGKKSHVSCIVDKANPLPTFKWQYQTSDCQDSDCSPDDSKWQSVPQRLITPWAVPTENSTVEIESDRGGAFYRCQAFNSLGNASQVIRFVRLGKNVLSVRVCKNDTL